MLNIIYDYCAKIMFFPQTTAHKREKTLFFNINAYRCRKKKNSYRMIHNYFVPLQALNSRGTCLSHAD